MPLIFLRRDFMKIYGTPNQVVNAWKGKGSRKKLVTLFVFDEKGEYELDENSISSETLGKLKVHFKVEEVKPKKTRKKEV